MAKEIFTGVHVVLVKRYSNKAHCHKVMHLAQCCTSETFHFYMDHLGIYFFNNMFSMIHRQLYLYFQKQDTRVCKACRQHLRVVLKDDLED